MSLTGYGGEDFRERWSDGFKKKKKSQGCDSLKKEEMMPLNLFWIGKLSLQLYVNL